MKLGPGGMLESFQLKVAVLALTALNCGDAQRVNTDQGVEKNACVYLACTILRIFETRLLLVPF